MAKRRAVLIAGPTASGKSARALQIATEEDAIIINTDAMQVYQGLQVLTAQPDESEREKAQHRLYGSVPPQIRHSTGAWLRDVKRIIAETNDDGRTLIFAGGTGLYFASLEKGLSQIPEVDDELVAQIEDELRGAGRTERMAALREHDPELADRLGEADMQRTVRAIAVRRGTGKSLSSWQAEPGEDLLAGFQVERLVISPPRATLLQKIETRFAQMMRNGAVEEVQALVGLDLAPSLPVSKAIGVQQIAAWLAGKISEPEAVELATIATRQYAKRQMTWLRARMAGWKWES